MSYILLPQWFSFMSTIFLIYFPTDLHIIASSFAFLHLLLSLLLITTTKSLPCWSVATDMDATTTPPPPTVAVDASDDWSTLDLLRCLRLHRSRQCMFSLCHLQSCSAANLLHHLIDLIFFIRSNFHHLCIQTRSLVNFRFLLLDHSISQHIILLYI